MTLYESERVVEKLTPAQAYFMACTKKYMWFCAGRGSGKCFGKDTEFLMYDGTTKKVQDLCVGDVMRGWDNTPRQVLSTCIGQDEMYEIKPFGGRSHIVNSFHNLVLRHNSPSQGKINEVYDIELTDYINSPQSKKNRRYIFKVPIEYPEASLALDPYIVG